MKTRNVKIFIVVFAFALICVFIPTGIYASSTNGEEETVVGVTGVNVYTFNVASGACSIIEFEMVDEDNNNAGSQYILVDAGTGYTRSEPLNGYNDVVNNIKTFMNQKSINKFEYVILSHYDSDHMKMLKHLLTDSNDTYVIEVGQFVCKRYDTTIENALSDAKDDGLTPMYGYYEEVTTIISDMAAAGLANPIILSPSYTTSTKNIGKYITDENGKYIGVKVTLRFLNDNGSYFSELITDNNTNPFDWKLASNNDSLVFVMRYYDPSHFGDLSHVKKILFCGDIQGNAMADLIGMSYEFDDNGNNDASDDIVLSTSNATTLSAKFKKYASDCDLVMWPHHGFLTGVENPEFGDVTEYDLLKHTTVVTREDFTDVVGKGEETICFVSTKTKKSISEIAQKWNDGDYASVQTFDVPSLKTFKDDSFYTSCLSEDNSNNGIALIARFDVINETAEEVYDNYNNQYYFSD